MSIAEALRGQLQQFTPQERRVARVLLAGYPRAGLGSAAELAASAGVSAPTVVRFARALGFGGYAELQAALIEEVSERHASPLSQAEQRRLAGPVPGNWLSDGVRTAATAIEESLGAIPLSELETAVALLANPKLRVTAFGGRFSGFIARYLILHLQQVRSGVRPQDPMLAATDLIDADARDVVVIYDFRRHQLSTIHHARRLADAGAKIICITDPWLSPVAQVSTAVLPTSVQSTTPFDSAAPAFVLTELLVGAVLDRIGDPAIERMRRWDEVTSSETE